MVGACLLGKARGDDPCESDRVGGYFSVVDVEDDGCPGVTRGAAGEQPDAAAVLAQRRDQLGDGAEPGRALRVTENEAAAADVRLLQREAGLAAEVDVVHGERVMRRHQVNGFDLRSGRLERAGKAGSELTPQL